MRRFGMLYVHSLYFINHSILIMVTKRVLSNIEKSTGELEENCVVY